MAAGRYIRFALASVPAFGLGLALGLWWTRAPAAAPAGAEASATANAAAIAGDGDSGGDSRGNGGRDADSGARALGNPPARAEGAVELGERVPFANCELPIPALDGHPHDPPADSGAWAADELDLVLDLAADHYESGDYLTAYGCAELAADVAPAAVDAHHLRASAAAALGYDEVARGAYAMALALDPDDPETLGAAADFYINVQNPKRRDTTMLGYEYAHRGRTQALARRRHMRPLRARLTLLEAQALNDLGVADQALLRVEETLRLEPALSEAKYERAVSLLNLCRFEDAARAFEAALALAPDDPYAHHHLGMVYEWLGREDDADSHQAIARSLAPEEFLPPVLLSSEAFHAELARAVAELPAEMAALLDEVSLEVHDVPALADLTAVEPPFSPTILGLYRGLPLGLEPAPGDDSVPPRAVILYRKNLARAVRSRAELDAQIRRTLLHELGHLQGLDETDLRLRGLD
ncbi:metallopeptidase family protein [Haliangium ochraceum]|uniref:Tetratricopeptide repeat protein n=1 Tax=Haliangium ochraceum (strain DSM 14365 / JCM 11303 / SMP-2) TaxID=502025 RepID=D0LGB1_HALO1|nr:metallopeptidase family protein [Haliangium ochraceum]ACY18136.1 protein of unknown function DUF1025 [Haliangium ochraceum DSM 14365]